MLSDMRRRLRAPVAAALVLFAVAAANRADMVGRETAERRAAGASLPLHHDAGDEIAIGMSAALTGASGRLGAEVLRGARLYLDAVNARGGVSGHSLRLMALDDGYDPVRAIHNTLTLIERDRVRLLFGYVGTPTVTRVLPLLARYGERAPYLLFPFTGAEPQRQGPYAALAFNLRASYREEIGGLVDRLLEAGRRRIAVFYQADAYGRSGWDGVRRALARHSLAIAGEATYARGTDYAASLKAQVDILRAAAPDAVIAVGAYAACAAFVRDAVDAGWDVPIANLSFVFSEGLLDLLLAEAAKTGRAYTAHLINSQVVPSYEDVSLSAVREYRTLMDSEGERPYSFVSFEGFLDAKLLVEVLRRTGGRTDRESIRRAFESLERFDLGIDVPVSFGGGRNQGLNAVYYTRVDRGRFVPLVDWGALAPSHP